jgi:hypothetical protein
MYLSEVDHVVMFDFPLNPVDYIHRAGRCGRAGRKGLVTALVAKRDKVGVSCDVMLARTLFSLSLMIPLSSRHTPARHSHLSLSRVCMPFVATATATATTHSCRCYRTRSRGLWPSSPSSFSLSFSSLSHTRHHPLLQVLSDAIQGAVARGLPIDNLTSSKRDYADRWVPSYLGPYLGPYPGPYLISTLPCPSATTPTGGWA